MLVEPTTAPPRTGRMGVSAASLVFEAWGWLFREQPIEDYGIDAHVEPLDGPEQPARQLLALQIKTGASFFAEETPDGWWFRDIRRHWHYWLGHVLPVVIILYNPQTGKLFWQHAEANLVQLTGEEGKLLIPRGHVLDSSGAGRDRLRQIVREFRRADPLADSLPLLPPSAAGVLRAATTRPGNTMMVAWQLANGRHQPDLTADSLLKGLPVGSAMAEASSRPRSAPTPMTTATVKSPGAPSNSPRRTTVPTGTGSCRSRPCSQSPGTMRRARQRISPRSLAQAACSLAWPGPRSRTTCARAARLKLAR